MNENYEREINLKWLLYRVLRGWRSIVAWAIVIATVVGVGSLGIYGIRCLDPDFIQKAELAYDRAYASWVATSENFEKQLENITEAKRVQEEYNEKSILMQIDPLRDFHGSFELYVYYDYQIMPNMVYQNVDLSDRILKAYATYMTNGELYQRVIDNVNYELERRYLSEILDISVDYTNNMISVSVEHETEEKCREILAIVEQALKEKYADISATIAEHTLKTTNSATYETVNLELKETQKENLQAVTSLDISMQEAAKAYEEWQLNKEGHEPVLEYTLFEQIKNAIKMFIIGGVVGAVAVSGIIVFDVLMSGKLLNPEDLKNRFGLRVIGQLPTSRVKKPFAFVSRWVSKFGGVTVTPEDHTRLARMIGTSIKSDLFSREEAAAWKKVAFTGMLSAEELQTAVDMMELDKDLSVVCAADILTSAESIERVTSADCVVLVEKQEQSVLGDITKELEALKAWNKPVLGAVVMNADAVM